MALFPLPGVRRGVAAFAAKKTALPGQIGRTASCWTGMTENHGGIAGFVAVFRHDGTIQGAFGFKPAFYGFIIPPAGLYREMQKR